MRSPTGLQARETSAAWALCRTPASKIGLQFFLSVCAWRDAFPSKFENIGMPVIVNKHKKVQEHQACAEFVKGPMNFFFQSICLESGVKLLVCFFFFFSVYFVHKTL